MLLASIHKLSNNPYINAQAQIVVNDCNVQVWTKEKINANQYTITVRVDKAVFRNLVALGAFGIKFFLVMIS
jgi:hypothetical protein